ncbi:ABC transporter ATP-binding protein [Thermoactinomyces sp. CICC 10521]|nr:MULTISPECIES: ABC transporter ATP-binding protein [unclassified Thermoactinomyces]MBH8598816.1 ABC transporter ATP-binding protein [Thermoactinomyces sp. CICC 10523]MBH8604801.1 ABC transporter ATP-binding protein [Thermoactinomyces sp. CICC 10522]MBH8607373.1 ABC transporter ATP-binding protein [Thermoactinomyces sp. CICC 10521]
MLTVNEEKKTENHSSASQVAVECRDVCKSFYEEIKDSRSWKNLFLGKKREVKAVHQISFQIRRNEVFGLLGPNGSGKSTLIRLLSTLLFPDRGQLTIFGHDVVRDQRQVRRFINRVSVEASFFKKLSAIENLRYAARIYGLNTSEGERKALSILRRLGMNEDKAQTSLENLSRGMQQKVAIARALMTSPTLLLLDEPTTGLDPKSKRDVQEYVEEVMETHDATIILTTHDMDEAERLCDRIAIIDHGKIVAMDTAEGLKKQIGTASMEEVFFRFTGKSWEDVLADENTE